MNARLKTAMQHWSYVASLLQPARNAKEYAKPLLVALGLAGVVSGVGATMLELTPNFVNSQADASTQKIKYDAVLRMCGSMHSADQAPSNIQRDNYFSPMSATVSYFESRGILPNFATGLGAPEPFQIKVLQGPAHGTLVPGNALGSFFFYHADPSYLGVDKIISEVEVLGKKFKVIQTLVIHNSGDFDHPTDAAKALFNRVCPSNNSSSPNIIWLKSRSLAS